MLWDNFGIFVLSFFLSTFLPLSTLWTVLFVDQWQVRQLPIGLVNHQKFQHNHKRHKEFKDPQHKKLNKLKQHKERLDNKLNHNKDRKLHQKIKSPKENQVGHLLVLGTIINK
ncbi:hypothetical protein GLYMA_02G190201v4 [Glycine max]|nr:hypothetical protein GLYMA_02G190201v4 [Glycine max]KAH1061061.1 hypothetical protein GYH30_004521 [Glycine max]